jgi:hypothetical protein
VHGLHQMYHSSEIVLDASMVLLGDKAQMEAYFSPFGDRCVVCAERTIGSEFILYASDGNPR